ncbi:3185_t:CDS:2, partial [Acaulospora morrowiae]
CGKIIVSKYSLWDLHANKCPFIIGIGSNMKKKLAGVGSRASNSAFSDCRIFFRITDPSNPSGPKSYFFLRTIGTLGTKIEERNQKAPESQKAGPSNNPNGSTIICDSTHHCVGPLSKSTSPPPSSDYGKINKEGLALIEKFEGFRENFYTDPSNQGIKTIGFGHACHVDPNKCNNIHPPITRAQGEVILLNDLVTFEKCVTSLTTFKVNSNQFSALVSLSFNIGCPAYQDSTLRKLLNAGNTKGASGEFGRWVYSGKKVLDGLVARRQAERNLFCKNGGC